MAGHQNAEVGAGSTQHVVGLVAGGSKAVLAQRGERHWSAGAAHNDELNRLVRIGGWALADQRVELLEDPHGVFSTGAASGASRDALDLL